MSSSGHSTDAAAAHAPRMRVERVRPAYQQVADNLRAEILSGRVGPDQRLPSEAELMDMFGVSRGTVREALRSLVSQNLIETRRGVHGGSFVSNPDPERVVAALGATLGLLVETPRLQVADLLEARLLLEPVATRLATERANPETVETIVHAANVRREPDDATGFVGHLDFHTTVLMATGNLMITMMGQPVADVLRTRLLQATAETAESSEWDKVDADHRHIAACIASGDASAAEDAMRQHLNDLRSLYQRAGC